MRTTLLAGLVLLLAACGAPAELPQDAASQDATDARLCVPGTSQGCACTSGAMGAQECNAGGSGFLACVCTGPMDAGTDAPHVDAGVDARDIAVDGAVVDVATDASNRCADATVAPYNACTSDCECGPNSACVMLAAGSMPHACLAACTSRSDCPVPTGVGLVSPVCEAGRCHIAGCSLTTGVPGCPVPLHCIGVSPGSTAGECQP